MKIALQDLMENFILRGAGVKKINTEKGIKDFTKIFKEAGGEEDVSLSKTEKKADKVSATFIDKNSLKSQKNIHEDILESSLNSLVEILLNLECINCGTSNVLTAAKNLDEKEIKQIAYNTFAENTSESSKDHLKSLKLLNRIESLLSKDESFAGGKSKKQIPAGLIKMVDEFTSSFLQDGDVKNLVLSSAEDGDVTLDSNFDNPSPKIADVINKARENQKDDAAFIVPKSNKVPVYKLDNTSGKSEISLNHNALNANADLQKPYNDNVQEVDIDNGFGIKKNAENLKQIIINEILSKVTDKNADVFAPGGSSTPLNKSDNMEALIQNTVKSLEFADNVFQKSSINAALDLNTGNFSTEASAAGLRAIINKARENQKDDAAFIVPKSNKVPVYKLDNTSGKSKISLNHNALNANADLQKPYNDNVQEVDIDNDFGIKKNAENLKQIIINEILSKVTDKNADVFAPGGSSTPLNKSDNMEALIQNTVKSLEFADNLFQKSSINAALDLNTGNFSTEASAAGLRAIINKARENQKNDAVLNKARENQKNDAVLNKAIENQKDDAAFIVPKSNKIPVHKLDNTEASDADWTQIINTSDKDNVKQVHSKDVINNENKILEKIIQSDNTENNKSDVSFNNLFMTKLNNMKENGKINKSSNELVIHKDSIVKDVIKAVKYMEIRDIKELTVRVNPKELGEIAIKVTMENGVMKANITAKNEETYHIINSNLPDINSQLAEQNVKIQSFSVDIFNGQSASYGESSEGYKKQGQHRTAQYLKDDESISNMADMEDMDLYNNNLNILA